MTDTTAVRCFLGITADDLGLTDGLMALMKAHEQRQPAARVRWTPREFLHLTLVFMGQQTQDKLEALMRRLDQEQPAWRTFPVAVDTISHFPDATSAIIAGRLTTSPALATLQTHLLDCLHAMDMNVDTRPYLPHVTLARGKDTANLLATPERCLLHGTALALSLYRSDPGVAGSHYTVIRRWSFISR